MLHGYLLSSGHVYILFVFVACSSITAVPQPIASPHSTTSVASCTMLTNNLVQKEDNANTDLLVGIKKEPEQLANVSIAVSGQQAQEQQQYGMQLWVQLGNGQSGMVFHWKC